MINTVSVGNETWNVVIEAGPVGRRLRTLTVQLSQALAGPFRGITSDVGKAWSGRLTSVIPIEIWRSLDGLQENLPALTDDIQLFLVNSQRMKELVPRGTPPGGGPAEGGTTEIQRPLIGQSADRLLGQTNVSVDAVGVHQGEVAARIEADTNLCCILRVLR
jgi:hypothetical protein